MIHRRAIELLKQAGVFCPAVVPDPARGGYSVYSAMKVLGSGATIEAALAEGQRRGLIDPFRPLPSFQYDGVTVVWDRGVVATCVSRSMAERIANALNQYAPNERGL